MGRSKILRMASEYGTVAGRLLVERYAGVGVGATRSWKDNAGTPAGPDEGDPKKFAGFKSSVEGAQNAPRIDALLDEAKKSDLRDRPSDVKKLESVDVEAVQKFVKAMQTSVHR